jgi:hypothetical protein
MPALKPSRQCESNRQLVRLAGRNSATEDHEHHRVSYGEEIPKPDSPGWHIPQMASL